jgi:hypothetical protein
MATQYCDCEHECHPSPDEATTETTRRGSAKHAYGDVFDEGELTAVRTIYGLYRICKYCIADHPLPPEFVLKPGETP